MVTDFENPFDFVSTSACIITTRYFIVHTEYGSRTTRISTVTHVRKRVSKLLAPTFVWISENSVIGYICPVCMHGLKITRHPEAQYFGAAAFPSECPEHMCDPFYNR